MVGKKLPLRDGHSRLDYFYLKIFYTIGASTLDQLRQSQFPNVTFIFSELFFLRNSLLKGVGKIMLLGNFCTTISLLFE